MYKPTYYLWSQDFVSEKEYKETQEKYKELGFRVVTFENGEDGENFHEGLKLFLEKYHGLGGES